MSFSTLSPLYVVLGLAGLAGLLYALQRLRVRHQEVTVVTTLFWKEAVEEARARVLVKRFRHPWAYALLLLIAALLWIALAGPSASAGGAKSHVLVLDGSARMQGGTRFADALSIVRARAAELPRASTRVVVAGAFPVTLLDAGEELVLFDERARELAPEATAASLERALLSLAAEKTPEAGRVRSGIDEVRRTGDLRGKPAIIVHGRADALVPVNHTSRPYLGLNRMREGNASRLSYIEVTHGQHFDAFLGIPGFDTRFVPLHVYFNRAMDAMYAHLKHGAPLPASQVVRTTPRGGAPGGAPALQAANLPAIVQAPAAGDRITVTTSGSGAVVNVPD